MIRLDPTKIIRIYPSWWPAKVPEPDFNFVEVTSQLTSLIALATKLTDAYSQLMLSAYSNFSSAYKWKKKLKQGRVKHDQAVGPQHSQRCPTLPVHSLSYHHRHHHHYHHYHHYHH